MNHVELLPQQKEATHPFFLRLLSGFRWWAGCFIIFFLMLFLTAPSFLGIHLISASAVGSCFLYAMLGFVIGFGRSKC